MHNFFQRSGYAIEKPDELPFYVDIWFRSFHRKEQWAFEIRLCVCVCVGGGVSTIKGVGLYGYGYGGC